MATQPGEQQGNSNRAEPPADVQVPTKEKYDVPGNVGSGGASEIWANVMDNIYYHPLLRATFRGDWKLAKCFFEHDSASKTAKITSRSETVLHVAALSAQDQFLENLVELISPNLEALELVDCDGQTALHIAVRGGRIRMVKALVRSNPRLTQLPDNEGRVPLEISARVASQYKEIAWFLVKNTTDDGPSHPFSSPSAIFPITALILGGHHDMALYIVRRYHHLITMKSGHMSILDGLAMVKSNFLSGTRLNPLELLIYKCISVDLSYKTTDENSNPDGASIFTKLLWNATKVMVPTIKRIHDIKLRHTAAYELARYVFITILQLETAEIAEFFQEMDLLTQATVKGISELVKLSVQFFPLIWISPYARKLRTIAVACRQESILRLFLKASSTDKSSFIQAPTPKESTDMMLAITDYHPEFYAVTNISGAAFKMQKELQWFKGMERWITLDVRIAQEEGKSFWEIFVEKHDKLRENGEQWVKKTADSCMLVSTLIATVLFAAVFTVPGGNNGNTGAPLLLGQDSLLVFMISDALGLVSSIAAILIFLAILTSRYEPLDFLESLPKKIITGLVFLFLSLAFMLVAFVTTLTIVLDKRLEWVVIPITLLASLPVFLFARLQLPLLYQMVKSTYGPSIFRPESIWE